ncbi:Autophagy protein 5 [Coniochaeta hoffmannii]|uniref:Autophagy protein 5 n=1 Tax=Coniochaeta hoffmannii TaxID=91930 RepID=A0AA38R7F1_9PEZI|nr:Autophagy protein 5 [Coniochaeta hoffmannii]
MASPSSPNISSGRSRGLDGGRQTAGGITSGGLPDARGSPSPGPAATTSIPRVLWSLEVPLHITHPSDDNRPPFVVSIPRFSYLALLLPRLTAYFGTACSSFHHEEVQLRNLPVGLLVDLYQPSALPWRLVVGEGPEWDIGDTFLNGAKEADFVRNNNAQQIMSLSKADTTALWNAVQDNDYNAFAKVNNRLLNPPTPLKSVPLRIYIPSTPNNDSASAEYKVMQTLMPPRTSNRVLQTLGTALRTLLPTLFPSSRDPVLANVIMHGAAVPLSAPLEELMREAAYPDGWLCLIVVLL